MMQPFEWRQPQGFYAVAFGEMCERFSYYGTQTLLVLYLISQFFLNDNKSYLLYGEYAAFAYALPVFGGIIADRFLGILPTMIIGGVLLVLGNVCMAIPSLQSFYLGLALNCCGIGLYKPNSASLIGRLYRKEQHSWRDSGFTLFYLGMNVGAVASPFVYGLLKSYGYRYSFLVSACILLISGMVFLYKKLLLKSALQENLSSSQKFLAYLLIMLGVSVIILLFFYPALLEYFLLGCAVVGTLFFSKMLFNQEKSARNRLLALLILNIFGMCFFAASLQVGSSINLFIERDVHRTFLNWQIPAIMFTSLYPLAVLVAAPFVTGIWKYLAKQNKEPLVSTKLCWSLLFLTLGFICFMLSAIINQFYPHSHWPLLGIVLGNLGLGIGEVCLMPSMLSAISGLAPLSLQGTLMGTWYLFVALGGYLSGWAARLTTHSSHLSVAASSHIYAHAFLHVAMTTLVIAIILWFLRAWINGLVEGKESQC